MLLATMSALLMIAPSLATRFYLQPDSLAPFLEIQQKIPPGVPIAEYRAESPLLYFKLNRPALFGRNRQEVRRFLEVRGPR